MLCGSTVSTHCKGQAVIQLQRSVVLQVGESHIANAWLAEWRWMFSAHVWMDASAGLAIGSR